MESQLITFAAVVDVVSPLPGLLTDLCEGVIYHHYYCRKFHHRVATADNISHSSVHTFHHYAIMHTHTLCVCVVVCVCECVCVVDGRSGERVNVRNTGLHLLLPPEPLVKPGAWYSASSPSP